MYSPLTLPQWRTTSIYISTFYVLHLLIHQSILDNPLIMAHLSLPPLAWLKEHLAIDPSQPSGLVWIKNYSNRKASTMAGSVNTNGYFQVRIKGKLYLTHRIIYYLINKQDPGDQVIDHIYSKDNHVDIRCSTYTQNSFNSKHQAKLNSSDYKGVTWDRRKARVSYKGVTYDLGRFDDEMEAQAYDRKARELEPRFAFLNFP
jgi:hypothetical protein